MVVTKYECSQYNIAPILIYVWYSNDKIQKKDLSTT